MIAFGLAIISATLAANYTPDPYYAFAPVYKTCDPIVTSASRLIGTPEGTLALQPSPALPATVRIQGTVTITDGCGVCVKLTIV